MSPHSFIVASPVQSGDVCSNHPCDDNLDRLVYLLQVSDSSSVAFKMDKSGIEPKTFHQNNSPRHTTVGLKVHFQERRLRLEVQTGSEAPSPLLRGWTFHHFGLHRHQGRNGSGGGAPSVSGFTAAAAMQGSSLFYAAASRAKILRVADGADAE